MKHYDNLTPKQKLFVDAYILNRGNATQAYIDAGYKAKNRKTAASAAYRLKSDKNIQEAIKERAVPDEMDRVIMVNVIIDQLKSIAYGQTTIMKWFEKEGEATPKHADIINAGKTLLDYIYDGNELSKKRTQAEIERIKAQTELLKSRINSGENEQDRVLEDIENLENMLKEDEPE